MSRDDPSLSTMRGPTIYGHTHVVGLIGWPVEHSVSPPMHNAAFAALGLDWCYVPFPVHPDVVAEALYGARALGLRPAASAIGAVNTVIVREGRLIGHNTDVAGFLRALEEAGFEPKSCSALVLGAGGAARAVVYALASVGAQVHILNRTPERAASLAAEFAGVDERARLRAGPLNAEALSQIAPKVQLVVNSTPRGMWPEVESSPWPEAVPYPHGAMLYDLIYNPRETQLMRRARDAGATAVNGLRMLVHQGAEAFELWTGVHPPVDVMYAACCAALGGG